MRAAIGSTSLALVVALAVGAGVLAPARASAAAAAGLTPAVIAIGAEAATATRADGSARVELPWLRPGDSGAAVSPGGGRIAFSSDRGGSSEIYVVNVATGALQRLTDNAKAEDVDPSWSPDGRRIVWASGPPGAHDLFAMAADGTRKHRLVAGPGNDVDPAWSPDGARIAFASNRGGSGYQLWVVGSSGGDLATVAFAGQARAPAWSPPGDRLAFTGLVGPASDVWVTSLDGVVQKQLTTAARYDGQTAWSPDGGRLAFVSERGGARRIWLMRADGTRQRPLTGSQRGDDSPDWAGLDAAVAPSASWLLPDLDQRAPSGLVVIGTGSRFKLGFTSAVDNLGSGPIHIRGTRVGAASTMRADQIVHGRGGRTSVVREIGRLAFEPHPPHYHWHLAPYERYELRRAADFGFLARDGKSGFCLLDRWGHARRSPGIVPGPPRFVGDCAAGNRQARRVDEGTSIGYTDRYPAFFHGQDIDISGLAPGLYVLVHRANPEGRIRELRYSNNAASVLVRLTRPGGPSAAPAVEVLRRCEGSEQCSLGPG